MRLIISLLSLLFLAMAIPAFAEMPLSVEGAVAKEAGIYNAIGIADYYQGQYASAESQFKEVVKIAPRSAEGRFNLGLALHAQGKHKAAAEQFKTAKELAPDNPVITSSETLKAHLTM